VSFVNIFTVFTGVFQRQELLIHVLNFELCRLCTVLLGQIVCTDVVNHHHLAVGFESGDSAAELYLEQSFCDELILAALAFSKATQKNRKFFFSRSWEARQSCCTVFVDKMICEERFFPKPSLLQPSQV